MESKLSGEHGGSGFRSDDAPTLTVDVGDVSYAYRRFGAAGAIPLVLCMRFRGTIDHWDPAFLETLSAERDVIVFDNAGIGQTSGEVPGTIGGMADDALRFIDALGLTQIDLLGWSMGGFVALAVALKRPDVIRRLIVAGSNPGNVPNAPASDEKVWQVAPKLVNDDEDFLYLFFPDTAEAREAGVKSLRRLDSRLDASHSTVAETGWRNQMRAIFSWASGDGDAWPHLDELKMPILAANGAHDVMTDAYNTYAIARRLPNATALVYGDAGHAFLFQHPENFGKQVLDFLH
jgi:pimeloyl-ACP methyl ester carboxylesterase